MKTFPLVLISYSLILLLSAPLHAENKVKQKAEKEKQLTPVEDALMNMLMEYFDELEPDRPRERRISYFEKEILRDFRKHAPKWTKEDARLLRLDKPLVKDFNRTRKNLRVVDIGNRQSFWYRIKLKNRNLTELEKRALQDLLVVILSKKKRRAIATTIDNAKAIYSAISEYASNQSRELGSLGDNKSANEVLRQLFELGCIKEERSFFVKGIDGFIEGDNKFTGKQALANGENVWAINAGVNEVSDNPNIPLLLCPLKMKNGKLVADPEPFGGQVVVLYADGAAMVHKIGPKGEIMTDEGPLYSAKHPVWRDKEGRFTPPDFRLPEPLPIAKKK